MKPSLLFVVQFGILPVFPDSCLVDSSVFSPPHIPLENVVKVIFL